MRHFLLLSASIAILSVGPAVYADELPWPYNLPRDTRYFPEDEAHLRRDLELRQRSYARAPVGVRKMSHDPSEKFWLDFWNFEDGRYSPATSTPPEDDTVAQNANATTTNICSLRPPLAPHTVHKRAFGHFFGYDVFARDFNCPSGTTSCSNVGSDLCCPTGESCVNTGSGIGCCPTGSTCGSQISGCDISAGYKSCPGSNNGGCCVPGAACLDTGCVVYGTQTVTTTLPTRTVTSSQTTPSSTTPTSGATIVVTSGYTTTVTISQQGTTATTTIVSATTIIIASSSANTSICSTGFSSCAVSLGGGCCRSGQVCVANTQCSDTTTAANTTAFAAPPVRPTSEASSTNDTVSVATVSTTASSSISEGCPTGFYMCPAMYLGGCCQLDRDCHSTSCPPGATTDVVTSGLTIAVGTPTSTCAQGWQSCAASDGGGCCPSGYMCSTSCINTSGGSNQAKQSPSTAAAAAGLAWGVAVLGVTAAIGMLCL